MAFLLLSKHKIVKMLWKNQNSTNITKDVAGLLHV